MKTEYEFKNRMENYLKRNFGSDMNGTNDRQVYEAILNTLNTILSNKRFEFQKKCDREEKKSICYLSMEFLTGRSMRNNLFNLGIEDEMKEFLSAYGMDLDTIYAMEPDAGLGNGGLGRLASCYMDALTTLGYSVTGFSILYEFGIFKQIIDRGLQKEIPDNWLNLGKYTLMQRGDEETEIKFYGKTTEQWTDKGLTVVYSDYTSVIAVPYDLLISGYDSAGANSLRLWSAKADGGFNMALFSGGEYAKSSEGEIIAESISKVLYPADDKREGKELRIKQQYFFVSASLQYILKRHFQKYSTLENLADKIAVHINDTHPSMSIPEMMRILMDEYGYQWDKAWEITVNTCAYTNHTIMSEALEKWAIDIFQPILPRIFTIIKEIDNRFRNEQQNRNSNRIGEMSIIQDGFVKMANLCVIGSHSVNGVSKLHSEIIVKDTFSAFYNIYPDKFQNVTNGITHRRWLGQANPELSLYLKNLLGHDLMKDLNKISDLKNYQNDENVIKDLKNIKRTKKIQIGEYIKKETGIAVNPDTLFDIQVKRLHEYKRQLLNALHITHLYLKIKDGTKVRPQTFIFGAKASSGYYMAKQIIRYICALSKLISEDDKARDTLSVIFLPDYRVTLAEMIIPSADLSEQISLAGKEASGTSNMKLMLNGAVTIGTMDGANVEIRERVGDENIFIFGMNAKEVHELLRNYRSEELYRNNNDIKRVIDFIKNKNVCKEDFSDIVNYLVNSDPYMNLADFESYRQTQETASKIYYNDPLHFGKMQLLNIASAGIFSADRSVTEYAQNIWHVKPVEDKQM